MWKRNRNNNSIMNQILLLHWLIISVMSWSVSTAKAEKPSCDSITLTAPYKFNCSNRNLTNMSQIVNLEVVATSTCQLVNVSFNLFENLHDNLFNVTVSPEIRELNFSYNRIKFISSLTLYTRYLYTEPITNVTKNVTEPYGKLELLDLSHNSLDYLPLTPFLGLTSLRTLRLDHNPIQSFDKREFTNNSRSIYIQELYLIGCQIEHVDPIVLGLFTYLTLLDLSMNRIRHLQPSFGHILGKTFRELHLNGNQLECDCELVWLKEFYEERGYTKPTFCYLNQSVVTSDEYLNEHYVLEDFNHVKREIVEPIRIVEKTIHTTNSSDSTKSLTSISQTHRIDLISEQLFCHRATTANISIFKSNTTIVLTCQIETYPSADIKWFIDKNDLAKLHTNKNNQMRTIRTHSHAWTNKTTHMHMLTSSVVLMYTREKLYRENFTCKSFFRANTNFVHSVLFEVRSEDGGAGFDYLNTNTLGEMRSGVGRGDRHSIRNMPFIYWIILGICVLFSLTVIVFAIVCIVKSNRNYNKRKRDAKSMMGDYYYDSINNRSRSAIYTRSNYGGAQTLKQPIKPIVIRDHLDYSSIYSDVATTSNNNSGPNRQSNINNCSSMSTTLTSSTPNNNDASRYSRLSANTRRQLSPADQSFDQDPVDQSFLPRLMVKTDRFQHHEDDVSTASSGDASSKLFEENFEEYKDPKFDDLSKPPKGGKYTYLKPPSSASSLSSSMMTAERAGGSAS